MVEIKSWCCGVVLCEGSTIHLAVYSAVKDGISLQYADLSDLDLNCLYVPNADFSYADLRETNFTGANLRGARLEGATVNSDTNFSRANLRDVNYTGCDLFSTKLKDTRLQRIHTEDVVVPEPGDIVGQCRYRGDIDSVWFSVWNRGVLIYNGPDEGHYARAYATGVGLRYD